MCTGFIDNRNDLLFGFNLDIDPAVWNYGIYMDKSIFTVTITVGKRMYFTHGVNKEGHFSNLPYMNAPKSAKGKKLTEKERIDLLTDRYLKNEYSYADVLNIVKTKSIVDVPKCTMHSLIGDKDGHILLVEPDCGYKEIADYGVISNFPQLQRPTDSCPWYGIDRYDKANEILSSQPKGLSALDGMKLLQEVKQEGPWATRVSFVYSGKESCVYYTENGDFSGMQKHLFL